MNEKEHIGKMIAPSGTLRLAINLGNPLLAGRDSQTKNPVGVSIDISHELARQLELPLELMLFDTAEQSVASVEQVHSDVGFFAVDPKRGNAIAFTAPYLLIEGCFLVRQDSRVKANADVDCAGVRIAVGRGSAYDLYLSRTLKEAQLIRWPTSPQLVEQFLAAGLEVVAGIKQRLEADAARLGGLRLLPERFMTIRQAMGIPKTRAPAAAEWLGQFVEHLKSCGFVAEALRRHRIDGVAVAPAV